MIPCIGGHLVISENVEDSPFYLALFNSFWFLTSCIIAKLSLFSIVYPMWGRSLGSSVVDVCLSVLPDVIVSISVLSVLYLLFVFMCARLWSFRLLRLSVLAFQVVYFVYVLAYIEFFRVMGTGLNVYYILQPELLTMVMPTVLTVWDVIDKRSILFCLFSGIVLRGVLVPWFARRLFSMFRGFNPFVLLLAFLILVPSAWLYGFLGEGYVFPGASALDGNPLLELGLSVWGRSSNYFVERRISQLYPPAVMVRNPGRITLNDDYPLMGGSDFAVCSNALAGNMSKFKEFCATDEDGDGYPKSLDCDDRNLLINPGAKEIPYNMVDEDCDGSDNPRMNVVLVVMESIDPEDMQLYGGPFKNTPNLVKAKRHSLVADEFYASVFGSSRGEFCMYCSIIPYENYGGYGSSLYQNLPCMSDILKSRGYRNGYFTIDHPDFGDLAALIKPSNGWDTFVPLTKLSREGFISHYWGVEDKALIGPFFQWVDADSSKPFFGVLRMVIGHLDTKVPKKYQRFNESKYNQVYYVDSFIGDVLSGLKSRGIQRDTLIVVTSDHRFLTTMEGKLPFIIINPAFFPLGERSSAPSSQIDVAPTIFGMLGVQSINSFEGMNIFEVNDSRRELFLSYSGGRRILRRGDNSLAYDMSSGQMTLSVNGKDESGVHPLLEQEMYSRILGYEATYTNIFGSNRVFDTSFWPNKTNIKKSNRSCWPMDETLGGFVWGSSAVASSNINDNPNRAMASSGYPDSIPCRMGDNAWSPNIANASQWLEVYYPQASPIKSVVVCGNPKDQYVSAIKLIDPGGDYHAVWEGKQNQKCSDRIQVRFERTEYPVMGVRVEIANTELKKKMTPIAIDAVGIEPA
jgi:hypothetical protein